MSCTVYLDNYHGQFMPGDSIVGRVVCSFSQMIKIREIRLKIRGREHTAWTKRESYYDSSAKRTKSRTVHYSGNNTFHAIQVQLEPEGSYPPGLREYPFTFNLPSNLPSTFQTIHGWIGYQIKATVDIPWGLDYQDVKPFELIAPVDLNQMINELQLLPTQYSDEQTVCCCWCASGPITMNVYMEKEAFVPGEVAKVKVEITNMSNLSIERLDVTMTMTVQQITTHPHHDSKYDHELIASARDTGVGAHGARSYEMDLEIPNSTVVPNFNLCMLFRQWASISVEAVVPGCHSNLHLEVPCKMGTIPVTTMPDPAPLYPSAGLPPYSTVEGKLEDKPPSYPVTSQPGPDGGRGDADGFDMIDDAAPGTASGRGAASSGAPTAPNAPPADSSPSAPSKANEANAPPQDKDTGAGELAPPTYNDNWEKPSAPTPPK